MAANRSNIDIAEVPVGLSNIVTLSRETDADSYSVGDLVSNDAYNGECDVVGEADKSQFIGVSNSTIDGADGTRYEEKVIVLFKAVIRVPLATGESTAYFGEMGAYSTGANGTEWTFANTATEAIAHCVSESIAATKSGRWVIDPYTVRAVTGMGFFEVPA